MRILLDENFPLSLVLRGTSDRIILDRLNAEELLFLTNDQEFLDLPLARSPVIVSQVTQALPIAVRVEIWLKAIREYSSRAWDEKLFEVFDDGQLHPWKVTSTEKSD